MPKAKYSTSKDGWKPKRSKSAKRSTKSSKSSSKTGSLAKRVDKLAKHIKQSEPSQFLGYAVNYTDAVRDYVAFNLCNYTSNQNVTTSTNGVTVSPGAYGLWGTPVANGAPDLKRILDKKVRVCFQINAGNEPDPISMSWFLVTLKDAASSKIDRANGNLVLNKTALLGDYWMSSLLAGGPNNVYLNPKTFNILDSGRFCVGKSIGNPDPKYGPFDGTQVELSIPIYNYITVQQYNTLDTPNDPSKSYYFILFNDNTSLDAQSPFINMNMLRTCIYYDA